MADAAVFLSIIIPVYNAEAYLPQCVDSVRAGMAHLSTELILVNDGSRDGSAALCDAYAREDARVQAIHQENGGASAARNAGIRAAQGQYIVFVDADDTVHSGAYAAFERSVADEGACDVAFLNAERIALNGVKRPYSHAYDKARIAGQSADLVLDYLTTLSHYPVSPCIKLLKRCFMLEHALFFREGMVCEDVDHTYRVLLAAKTFNCFDTPYYTVHVRENSVMTSPQNALKRFDATLWIIQHWSAQAQASPRRDVILAMLSAQYMYLCALYADLPSGERDKHKAAMQAVSWVMRHGRNPRIAIARLMHSALGLNLSSKIFQKAFI